MKILVSAGNIKTAKSYPYWEKFFELAKGHEIKKIEGILPFSEIVKMVNECDIWISIDSFLPHLCAYHKLKRGVVLWSKSDPLIFGYEHNINLLKSREYLRPDTYGTWSDTVCDKNAFVSPQVLLQEIEKGV
ncbi:MAG: hypothetical protein WC499_02690 [Patescibacteria group bacterium]